MGKSLSYSRSKPLSSIRCKVFPNYTRLDDGSYTAFPIKVVSARNVRIKEPLPKTVSYPEPDIILREIISGRSTAFKITKLIIRHMSVEIEIAPIVSELQSPRLLASLSLDYGMYLELQIEKGAGLPPEKCQISTNRIGYRRFRMMSLEVTYFDELGTTCLHCYGNGDTVIDVRAP